LRFVCILFLGIAASYALDHLARMAVTGLFLIVAAFLCAGASWLFAKRLGVTLEPRDAVGVVALILFIAGLPFLAQARATIESDAACIWVCLFGALHV
jgi:hypothetical protein